MLKINRGGLFAGAMAAATLIAVSGSVLAAAPAQAASVITPQVCETGTFYNEHHSATYVGNGNTKVYGQGGGTLSIAAGKTITVSGSLQGTATFEAGAIFERVSIAVSATVGRSSAVTTTNTYSWPVPKSQSTGWIEMGAHRYNISWTQGYYRTPCIWVQTDSGTLLGVTPNVRFIHS
ncbi:MAG: hypothetical protein JWO79_1836 [Actinomycetia bacterium]|nr:hypothetical protein [Actinomycetes bacterium]